MGKCRYCGESAGLLTRVHRECEGKHSRGLEGMRGLMRRYFEGSIDASHLQMRLRANRAPYFLTDEEVRDAAVVALQSFTAGLRRPFPTDVARRIGDFIDSVDISYDRLNHKGELDTLAMKLVQGYAVDFFARGESMGRIAGHADAVTSVLPLSDARRQEAYLNVLEKAADRFMADGVLTAAEYSQLDAYGNAIGMPLNTMPARYRRGPLARVVQAVILRGLEAGRLPAAGVSVPVMLGRGERVLWVFHPVSLFRERITREYVGRSRGMSYRICRGVTYRTGSFKGRPVEHSNMEPEGVGSLVVTNRNLMFHSPAASLKIPYNKIVGMTPYSDGLEVHKDEARPKRTLFQGFDPWFIMNVLNLINET